MQTLDFLVGKIRRKILRYLYQLNCLFLGDKLYRFHLTDGLKFEYPLNSAIGFSKFLGEFENSEVDFVRKFLNPGDTFIDVGANGGIFTLLASKQVQHGHIYAFEPDQRNLKILKHNLSINNITNVTILESALSNIEGETKFAIAKDGALNSLADTNRREQEIAEWQTVKVTTLDTFVRDYKVEKVNFIKIDTEGAEKLILEGGKETLSSNQLIIMFEASDLNAHGFGYLIKDFLADITNSGLNLYYFDDKTGLPTPATDYDERFGGDIYNFIASTQHLKLT